MSRRADLETGGGGPGRGAGGMTGDREFPRAGTGRVGSTAGRRESTHNPLPHIASEDDDSGDPRAAVPAGRPSSTRGLDHDGPGAGGHEASGRRLETDLSQHLARVRLLDGRTETDTM